MPKNKGSMSFTSTMALQNVHYFVLPAIELNFVLPIKTLKLNVLLLKERVVKTTKRERRETKEKQEEILYTRKTVKVII